jgi:hypothetical protein
MFELNKLKRDWAVGILKRQMTNFGEKFNKQWGTVTSNGTNLEPLIEAMQEAFEGLDEFEITRGLNTMRTKTFVPSLPEFRSWCRPENTEGWLSPDQAWAIAVESLDEEKTVVWTQEISQAFGFVKALLDMNDKFSAARAFKERYAALVEQAKAQGGKPKMYASLGHNPELRQIAIAEATQAGLLTMTPKENHALVGYITESKKPIPDASGHLAKLKEMMGVTGKSIAEREAARLAEIKDKKQRQIDALQSRQTLSHVDPFDDQDDYQMLTARHSTMTQNAARAHR